MRPMLVMLALGGCGFDVTAGATANDAPGSADAVRTDAANDAATDVATDGPADTTPEPAPAWCDPSATVPLCFSFDGTLGANVANEGTAAVSAQLTNVSQTAGAEGNAAQVGATSAIYIAPSTLVSGVFTIEVWFRLDSQPAVNGARFGLVDSNVTPTNLSLFLYRADAGNQLRCGIDDAVNTWTFAAVPTATWIHAACTCANGVHKGFINGVRVGMGAGACANGGGFATNGLTLGADNTGNGSAVGDRLLGAIDGVRLWTVERSEQEICAVAGSCP